MNQDELIEEVAAFLHTYLKAGYVKIDSFSKKIHPEIEGFDELFIIRFLLHEETKQYVAQLPRLLRQFKTVTTMRQQTNIAEVRGAIDWPETIRTRLETNYTDQLTFVTRENIRSYDTQENIVLKKLLSILHRHLYKNDYVASFFDASWFHEWKSLRTHIDDALRNNIYLQRVSTVELTSRMIYNTTKHRNPLYRQAANLLARYKRFKRGEMDEVELEQLLRETFILPQEEDVLFELYWVIQLIKQNTDESTLYLIDGRQNRVASWKQAGNRYDIYHDSTGPAELSFTIFGSELKTSTDPYVQRLYESFQQANVYGEQFFNRKQTAHFRQGRPDVIVTIRQEETNELKKIIIGEVKHTKRTSYAMTGLRELLDYMYLVKYKGDYITEHILVEGILCVAEMDVEQPEEQQPIQVVTPSSKSGLKLL